MRPSIPATLALLLAAAAAGAAELVPGWDLQGVWSSNVLHQEVGNEEADESVRTGPNLTIRNQKGDVTYDLKSQIRYEAFANLTSLDTNSLGDLDYFANGSGAWAITDLTKISLTDNFSRSNNVTALFDTTTPTPNQVGAVIRPGRQQVVSNDASASITHSLGPLWAITGRMEDSIFNPQDQNEVDSAAIVGSLELTRALTRRLVVGLSTVGQRNQSTFNGSQVGGNFLIRGGAIVQYQFSPTLSLHLNAGPGWSQPDNPPSKVSAASYLAVDPSTCHRDTDGTPVFQTTQTNGGCRRALYRSTTSPATALVVPGVFGAPLQTITDIQSALSAAPGSLSYYGTISLTKDWRNWSGDIALERSQNTRSTNVSGTINTSLTSSLRWTPTQLWTISLTGTYSLQTSAASGQQSQPLIALQSDNTLVPGFMANGLTFVADPVGVPFEYRSGPKLSSSQQAQFTTWRFELYGERRLSHNLTLQSSASYYRQVSDNQLASNAASGAGSRETKTLRVLFGVTWKFDPIPL